MPGSGPNPLTANPFRNDLPIPLGAWRDKSGLTLTATTEPDLIQMANGPFGMKWDHGGTTTDFASLDFPMPFTFAEDNGVPKFDFKLMCSARKLDAAADENADLCLQAQIVWFTPDALDNPVGQVATSVVPKLGGVSTTLKTLTTPALALMATATIAAANTATTGFARYSLDIGARLRAEGKSIYAGDIVQIRLSPNEAVGTTDMDLEVLSPRVVLRRTLGFADRLKLQNDI